MLLALAIIKKFEHTHTHTLTHTHTHTHTWFIYPHTACSSLISLAFPYLRWHCSFMLLAKKHPQIEATPSKSASTPCRIQKIWGLNTERTESDLRFQSTCSNIQTSMARPTSVGFVFGLFLTIFAKSDTQFFFPWNRTRIPVAFLGSVDPPQPLSSLKIWFCFVFLRSDNYRTTCPIIVGHSGTMSDPRFFKKNTWETSDFR